MKRQQGTPHNADPVHTAYSARAHEYITLFGHISSTAPEDRDLVDRWARGCSGRVVDVGCGPGHWTAYLTEAGTNAIGIDPVAEFVDHAQCTYPTVQFRRGTIDDLATLPAPLGGIFSWYSLIHQEHRHDPGHRPHAALLAYRKAPLESRQSASSKGTRDSL